MSKTVYLSNVTRFDELFTGAHPWDEDGIKVIDHLRVGKDCAEVGTYLVLGARDNLDFPRQSLSVRPTRFLLGWIQENVLVINRDRLHFEILVGKDGNCLAMVQHGQIIGNYWLTTNLRVESLPDFVKRTAPAAEVVYTFPNGFRAQADATYTWLRHANLTPSIGNSPEGGTVISLPPSEVSCLRLMQQANPARFGNAPKDTE